MNFFTTRNLSYLSGVLLILAIIPIWPYEYFILLRWVILGTSLIVGILFYTSKIPEWCLIMLAIAFVFNPIYPLYLSREGWIPIDLVGAVIFFMAAALAKGKK